MESDRALSDDQLNVAFIPLLSSVMSPTGQPASRTSQKLLARATERDLYAWLGSFFSAVDAESPDGSVSFSGLLDFFATKVQDSQNTAALLDMLPLAHKLKWEHSNTMALMTELGTPPFSIVERMHQKRRTPAELESRHLKDLYTKPGSDQPELNRISTTRGYGLAQPFLVGVPLEDAEMTPNDGTTHTAPVDVPFIGLVSESSGEVERLGSDEVTVTPMTNPAGSAHPEGCPPGEEVANARQVTLCRGTEYP